MLALERPALAASDPEAWLATHLSARFPPDDPGAPAAVVGRDALLVDGAALLRVVHDGITAEGTPGQAASHYVGDWFAGAVAGAVGFGLATGGCGFVVDAEELRWRLHPEGWPDSVALGRVQATLVLPSHPWADRPDVTVVDSVGELLERTVAAIVDAVEPILDACRSFARVGRPGMWNEVGDGLGGLLLYQDLVEVTPVMIELVDAALRTEAAPWKAVPSLRLASGRTPPVFVLQKGGCCLAYTREEWPADEVDESSLSEAQRAYRAAFPPPAPGEPWYCSNCSFRSTEDCDARAVAYHDLTHPV